MFFFTWVHISSNIVTHHDYDRRTVDQTIIKTQTSTKLLKKRISRYLPAWKKTTIII